MGGKLTLAPKEVQGKELNSDIDQKKI